MRSGRTAACIPRRERGSVENLHQLAVGFSRGRACVWLGGELDVLAAADLTELFTGLEQFPAELCLDLGKVTFIDSHGLAPIMNAACRREAAGRPPFTVVACSSPARRLLDTLGVGGRPLLLAGGWESCCIAEAALSVGPPR